MNIHLYSFTQLTFSLIGLRLLRFRAFVGMSKGNVLAYQQQLAGIAFPKLIHPVFGIHFKLLQQSKVIFLQPNFKFLQAVVGMQQR